MALVIMTGASGSGKTAIAKAIETGLVLTSTLPGSDPAGHLHIAQRLTVFLNDAGGEAAGHSDWWCVSTGAMVSNTPSRLISLWKRIAATCNRTIAKKAKAR